MTNHTVNTDLAIKLAIDFKNQQVTEHLNYYNTDPTNPRFVIALDTPDRTIVKPATSDPRCPFVRTLFVRPKFEKLDPSKGLLLFLHTIYKYPKLKSFKQYCILTNNKPTSFTTLRTQLIYYYNFVTPEYTITKPAFELLSAYNLID